MDQEVEALRIRIDGVRRGKDGRRIFTAAVKSDVIELARRWQRHGQKLGALAEGLGMHEKTLNSWLGRPKTKRRVRRVKVETQRPSSRQTNGITVTAGGMQIEGLQLTDVVELVRTLR